MRKKIKIVEVTGYTAAQITTAVNNALSRGWEFVQAIVISNKTFVIMQKNMAN